MYKELKEFGIYTSDNIVKIITNIDDNKIICIEYKASLFPVMSNTAIVDKISSIKTIRDGKTFSRDRAVELTINNFLDFAYLGQVENKEVIKELRTVIKERYWERQ